MAPSYATTMPVQPPHFEPIPFDSRDVPTVDLAFPERPPQTSLV